MYFTAITIINQISLVHNNKIPTLLRVLVANIERPIKYFCFVYKVIKNKSKYVNAMLNATCRTGDLLYRSKIKDCAI